MPVRTKAMLEWLKLACAFACPARSTVVSSRLHICELMIACLVRHNYDTQSLGSHSTGSWHSLSPPTRRLVLDAEQGLGHGAVAT